MFAFVLVLALVFGGDGGSSAIVHGAKRVCLGMRCVICEMTVLVVGTRVVEVAVRVHGQGTWQGIGNNPTGYAMSYNKYRAPVAIRAGADCAGKAACLYRASSRQRWSTRCRRTTYTDVDPLWKVVVWSTVTSICVANCVVVGVGTQSPIFFPPGGCLLSQGDQDQDVTLVAWYKNILHFTCSSPSHLSSVLGTRPAAPPNLSFPTGVWPYAECGPAPRIHPRDITIDPVRHTSLPFPLDGPGSRSRHQPQSEREAAYTGGEYTRSKS